MNRFISNSFVHSSKTSLDNLPPATLFMSPQSSHARGAQNDNRLTTLSDAPSTRRSSRGKLHSMLLPHQDPESCYLR